LLSLIKQDETYAQYLRSAMSEGGEIILTLDEEALAKAADQAAKDATDAAVKSYFANANQYGAEAKIAEGKAEAAGEIRGGLFYQGLTDEEWDEYGPSSIKKEVAQ
jgi:N-methylhydantoinase A/oxoprolinase/acetone carboxylase beta subunit